MLEQYNLSGSIKSIDMTTPLAISMTADNGLKIHVGQSTDLDTKMDELSKLLPLYLNKGISVGTLYLYAKGTAVYSKTSYLDLTPIELAEENTSLALPVDENGDGIDDNTGLPITPQQTDLDKDGFDDNTGLPMATPSGSTAPTGPTPTPTGGDDFQG